MGGGFPGKCSMAELVQILLLHAIVCKVGCQTMVKTAYIIKLIHVFVKNNSKHCNYFVLNKTDTISYEVCSNSKQLVYASSKSHLT